jgi:hypothetical protein
MTAARLSHDGRTLTVRVPMTFTKRGGRKLVISPDGVPSWAPPRRRVDNAMRYRDLWQGVFCGGAADDGHGAIVLAAVNRDRGTSRGATPPTPPGIRVRTTAVRRIKRPPAFPWKAGPDDGGERW